LSETFEIFLNEVKESRISFEAADGKDEIQDNMI